MCNLHRKAQWPINGQRRGDYHGESKARSTRISHDDLSISTDSSLRSEFSQCYEIGRHPGLQHIATGGGQEAHLDDPSVISRNLEVGVCRSRARKSEVSSVFITIPRTDINDKA